MTLEQLLKKAIDLARSGETDRAIPLFVKLVEKRPDQIQLRIYLAKSLGLAFRFEERDLLIENLLTASGRDPSVVVELAKTWEELDRPDLALALWEEAARSRKVRGSWSQVARLAERLNRLEQAGEALRRGALEDEPGPCWFWVQARLAQRLEKPSEALRTFETLYDRSKGGKWWRQSAHGMAAVYDTLGEYRHAWQCLQPVKEANASEAQKLARATPLCEPLEIPLAGKHHPDFDDSTSLTLLTGFPRSGTTLACALLQKATGQAVCDETLAMDRMLRIARAGRTAHARVRDLQAARQAYLDATTAILGGPLPSVGFIEKNPAMALWLPWIMRILPETRFLWIQRDWREVALSCWFTDFPLNGITARFRNWEALVEIMTLASKHGQFLHNNTSPSQAHQVSYETMVTSGSLPAEAIAFSLGSQAAPVNLEAHEPEFVNSPTYAEVRKPPSPNRLGHWKNYQEFEPDAFEKLATLNESGP